MLQVKFAQILLGYQLVTLPLTLGGDHGELLEHRSLAHDGPGKAQIDLI